MPLTFGIIKLGHSRLLFSLFSSFQQLTVNMFIIKSCRWLNSNCGPLVSEATALPTEPQPLPTAMKLFAAWSLIYYFFKFSPLKRKLKLKLRTLYLRLRLQTLKGRTLNLRLRLQTLKGRTLKAAKTVTTFRQSLSASKSTQKSVKNLTFLSQRSYLKRFVFIYALVSCVEIYISCTWSSMHAGQN